MAAVLLMPSRGAPGARGGDPELRSVPARVDELVLLDPGHHGPELFSNDFDRMFGGDASAREQGGRTRAVLENEILCVLAGLDAGERGAHRVPRFRRDDLRAGHILAVFGVIGYRVI